jgi:N-acetylglucosamine kinase-like BadF-type ATPase
LLAAREFDGRISSSLLSKMIKEKFKIDSPEKLITEVYKNQFDIASVAPLVIEAAEKNDAVALKIINEETDELILHISTMVKKLKQQTLKVSFIGGIISSENIFSKKLGEKIENQLPNVILKPPENPPAYGAVLMAKELLSKS